MYFSKTCLKKKEIDIKVKNYKKALLQLDWNNKANHFNNYFLENEENFFKTQESIRKIINISKKRTTDVAYIEIGYKTV